MSPRLRRRCPTPQALALLCLGLTLSGCALPAPTSGTLLSSEPTPVAEALFQVRGRHTDLISVHVVFPSDERGVPARPADGSRLPALVLVQGAFVATQDYLWLAEALAARGYVVALPEHPLDFALSATDNGRFARQLLTEPPAGSLLTDLVEPSRIAVAGHSLGGVVASKLALEGGFAALAFLASYPDSADADRIPSLGMPSLSLAGELDCLAPLSRVSDEASRLPSPSVLAVVQGATHYQFTASDQKDRSSGCVPTLPLDTAHERMAELLSRFLNAALAGHGTGADDLRQVPGTEVTER